MGRDLLPDLLFDLPRTLLPVAGHGFPLAAGSLRRLTTGSPANHLSRSSAWKDRTRTDQQPIMIIPTGLGSFDQHEAHFFVPGGQTLLVVEQLAQCINSPFNVLAHRLADASDNADRGILVSRAEPVR